MSEKQMCPKAQLAEWCSYSSKCAWWVEEEEKCAVLVKALALQDIAKGLILIRQALAVGPGGLGS